MKSYLSIISLFFSFSAFAQKEYFMLVGTYTSGSSAGVYVYKFNTANADFQLIDSVQTSNPSYIAVSPNEKYVYAVNEDADSANNGGNVTSFKFNNSTGSLSQLNQKPSKGNHPCYISVDKSGKWAIVGNYSSGSITVLPILLDGGLGYPLTTILHEGQSVNTERQNSPHVHSTVLSPDNRFLFVPDLGIDKVLVYEFNNRNGRLFQSKFPFVMTKAGSGPRHFIFHPYKKYAYLVEELTGKISGYKYESRNGKLELIQDITTLPPEYLGEAGSADIHISKDGKFLYASNRAASNTIAIYSVDSKTGILTSIGFQSSMGKTPRGFNFDPSGNFLLVANQNTDDIVIFKIDKMTGLLTDTGKKIKVSSPVCIKWINTK